MPGTIKITDLTALAAASLQSDDVLVIVDVHDTTMAPTGTDKKILVSSLFTNPGQFLAANGSAAAPSYAFTNDPDCGLYRIGANNIGVAVGGVKLLDLSGASVAVTGVLSVSSTSTFTGAITASGGVVGNLTGNVTGNVSGTAPAGSLTGTTLASNVVSSSLTTVGVIGSGTWQGTTVGAGFGGTGLASYTAGDLPYASGTTTVSKLGIGGANTVLTSSGSAPQWSSSLTGLSSVSATTFTGALTGNASTATKLQTARTINGVSFDGTANIIVSAATVGTLTFGTYLQAGDASFSGSAATISTNATAANTASTLVARDGSGNFAAGTITAALSGLASSATILANTRTIWGQSFNGSANVSGALSGATTGAFSSDVTVGGALTSSTALNVTLNGSDTAFAGAWVGVSNTANNLTWFQQLSASNNLDWWKFASGSSTKYMTLSATGLSITGTLAASSNVTVGGRVNGQAITSTADFTGTVAMAGALTVSAGGINLDDPASTVLRFKTAGVSYGYIGTGTANTNITGASLGDQCVVAFSKRILFSTDSGTTIHGQFVSGALTLANALTVSTGGITVSAGTTAVQALTATTGGFTGVVNTTSTTDSTSTTTGSLQTSGGLGVVKSVVVGNDVTSRHSLGNGSAPGVTSSATVSIVGTDSAGKVTVTSGIGWTAGDTVASVAFAVAYPTHAYPTVTGVAKAGFSTPAYAVKNVSTAGFDIVITVTTGTTTASDIIYVVRGD